MRLQAPEGGVEREAKGTAGRQGGREAGREGGDILGGV